MRAPCTGRSPAFSLQIPALRKQAAIEAHSLSRLKAGLHFGAAVLVKTLAGLVVIKLLAWKVGPEGFGLLGQLMTVVAIAGMLAGGGISNGLIKTLAKSPMTLPEGRAWFASAFTLTTIIALAVALLMSAFSGLLSQVIMPQLTVMLFVALAFSQVIIAYGNLVMAEASSRGDTLVYSLLSIIGTLVGAALVAFGVLLYGFAGAAYAVVLMPAMVGVAALAYLLVRRRHLLASCRLFFDKGRIKHLMSFSLVTLVGALSVPLAQLFIREVLGNKLGWEQVGLWQAVIKLSDVYMQFIGIVLINFVMPRYAAADAMPQVLQELKSTLFTLLLVLLGGFSVLYILREFIVELIFSKSFLPMTEYLIPQMVGDILRTIAAAISYVFLARGAVRVSLAFELAQGLLLALVFSLIVGAAGVMAPVYAHLITYLLLALVMAAGLCAWVKRKSA